MLSKSALSIKRSVSSLINGNWNLTSEQLAIQESALKFSKSEIAPYANEWDEHGYFPRDVIKKSADLGFGGLYCKHDFGGIGCNRLEASLVFEALATGCVGTTAYMTVHNMCAWVIDHFGNVAQKKRWLPELFEFEKFASYCLTEPQSGSDAASLKTVATLEGDYFIINGSKMFITGGDASDLYLVMCRTGPKEISCIAVESPTEGLDFGRREKKLGWNSHPTQLVTFDNVKVPKENLIGGQGTGFKIAMQALDGGRINISSCALGGAWFALGQAQNYMQERMQFGKKLVDHQYLRFKMAEALTKLTGSRIMVRHAAQLLDEHNPARITMGSMAKLFSTDNCFDVANMALQMHGGYGVMRSYGVERAFRDLRILQIVEGTNEIMRLVIAREMFNEPDIQN